MATLSTTSIIQSLLVKSPVITKTATDPNQVKQQLNQVLRQAAEFIRQYIVTQAQVGHKNKFKKDGDFQEETQVTFDMNQGMGISLPDFADEMDRGRRPGSYPPAAAILAWVREYNIQTRTSSSKRSLSVNQLVFLIQRSIYKNGIKARPFLKDSQEFAEKLAGDIAEQIILPSLASPLDKVFNK